MKRGKGFVLHAFLTLAVLVLCSGAAFAADGVILIDQSSLVNGQPFRITQPGSYRLSENLISDVRGFGVIEIDSDNVTLDLNGFVIDALGTFGIRSHDRRRAYRNIEIRNGSIINARQGIELYQSMHVTVKNMRIITMERSDTDYPQYVGIGVGTYFILHHNITNGRVAVICPGVITENVIHSQRIEFGGRDIVPCATANNSLGIVK